MTQLNMLIGVLYIVAVIIVACIILITMVFSIWGDRK